jgi:hypothetical protein
MSGTLLANCRLAGLPTTLVWPPKGPNSLIETASDALMPRRNAFDSLRLGMSTVSSSMLASFTRMDAESHRAQYGNPLTIHRKAEPL